MNNLPFTFRDFIIYFVPGSIVIFDILFFNYLLNIWNNQNLLDFVSKNQSICAIIFISISYVVGLLLSNNAIYIKLIDLYKLSHFFKDCKLNIDGRIKYSLKKYYEHEGKFFHSILDRAMKEHSFKELNSNLVWLVTKKIAVDNNSLTNKNNIERINALRNLVLQLLRVFILLLSINILVVCVLLFLLIVLLLINLLYQIQVDLLKSFSINLFVSVIHLFIISIFLYLSNIKIPTITDWLVRTIFLSYYVIVEDKDEKKIILLK